MDHQTLSELLGVDVEEYGVVELTRERFEGIRLELCPEKTLHLIIHAVQFQQEVPKLKSLLRTEKRNLARALSRANGGPVFIRKKRAKPKPIPKVVKRRAKKAQGRKRVVDVAVEVDKEDSNLIGCRSVKSHSSQQVRKQPATPVIRQNIGGTPIRESSRSSRSRSSSSSCSRSRSSSSSSDSYSHSASHQRAASHHSAASSLNSISSSSREIILPNRDDSSNTGVPAFKISSPARIALKSARMACLQQMKGWIAEIKAANPHAEAEKPVSAKSGYFKKKKECQKRRRHERLKLIKDNKVALIKLYGRNIFSKNWHMSRKDIESVLGILGEKMDVEEGVGEFMAMVDEAEEVSKGKQQ